MEFLNWSGKVPVERERLIMLVMVGRRADLHCLRRVVGMGSKSEDESGVLVKRITISSIVAGWKNERFGGGDGGGICGEAVVGAEEMRV